MLVKVSAFNKVSESQGKLGLSNTRAQGTDEPAAGSSPVLAGVGYQRVAIGGCAALLCQCLV